MKCGGEETPEGMTPRKKNEKDLARMDTKADVAR